MEFQGKENISVGISTEKTKPVFVTVNGKTFLTGGRWNDRLMADYVYETGQDRWIKVGELAKVACGSNTIPNKKRVRARLSSLFLELRGRGSFLAIEYNGEYNAASAVKIADLKSADDRLTVEAKLERMRKRKELTEDQYLKSMALVRAMESSSARS